MTVLKGLLRARIAQTGPITIADYMAECLQHPQHGYYTTRDPLGAAGDFITAPEISQMFGEMIGLALAQAWMDQGAPAGFALAELGPGRGTLMADILRATRQVPGFTAAANLHLVETSPVLRALQAKALPDAVWHDSVESLPKAPLFLIANEFFDALPIRQFQRHDAGWQERVVGIGADQSLVLGRTPAAPLAFLADRLSDTKPGDIVEHCPALSGIITKVSAQIADHGGAALIIDYGDWQSQGDTLQALAGGAYADPFAQPGQADLTAHVDFAAIAAHAPPARVSRVTPQGVFLERLGITERARALAAGLRGAARDSHIGAHRRLTHPGEMGQLFKVIALTPDSAPPFPGTSA